MSPDGSSDERPSPQRYDLTSTLIPFLDQHLVFPLLNHLYESNLYPAREVQEAQYELARKTNTYGYAMEVYTALHGEEESEEMKKFGEKMATAVEQHRVLSEKAAVVLDVLTSPDVASALRQDKAFNVAYLKDNFGLVPSQFEALMEFGWFQYSHGSYTGAAEYLYHYKILSMDPERTLSASWGKLACEILGGKWDAAVDEVASVRDGVDAMQKSGSGGVEQLYARTWLMHWSLFVYFNHPDGRTMLLETFLSPAYLNSIQTAAPWLLRYVAAAFILTSRSAGQQRLKAVLKVIAQEKEEANGLCDPVLDFLTALYVDFSFALAQKALSALAPLAEHDFFLAEHATELVEAARGMMMEVYCRVYKTVGIAEVSERLNLGRGSEEGERWVVGAVGLGGVSGLEAKIDLEKNVIELGKGGGGVSVYQGVIEKTRAVALRTAAMARAAAGSQIVAAAA